MVGTISLHIYQRRQQTLTGPQGQIGEHRITVVLNKITLLHAFSILKNLFSHFPLRIYSYD